MICRSVTATSRSLIKRNGFLLHAASEGRIELGVEIHAVSEDRGKVVRVVEIAQPDAAQGTGFKLREHIDIAARGIEVVAQH